MLPDARHICLTCGSTQLQSQCPFLTCRALHRLCARRHVTLANAVFRQADGTEVSPLTRCFSARGPLTPGACCRMGVYINCVSTAPQSARPLGHKTLHMQHLGSISAGTRGPLDPVAASNMRPLTPDHAMQRVRRVVDCARGAPAVKQAAEAQAINQGGRAGMVVGAKRCWSRSRQPSRRTSRACLEKARVSGLRQSPKMVRVFLPLLLGGKLYIELVLPASSVGIPGGHMHRPRPPLHRHQACTAPRRRRATR